MAKRRAAKGEFLLVRQNARGYDNYTVFSPTAKPKLSKDEYWRGCGDLLDCCAITWQCLTPQSLHLKPGGGPIRIRVERVK